METTDLADDHAKQMVLLIQKFMADESLRNADLSTEGLLLNTYVRKSQRCVGSIPVLVPCLDLARIDVEFYHQGKGFCAALLRRLTTWNHHNLYVESVMSPVLAGMLERRGFEKIGDPLIPNYYRLIQLLGLNPVDYGFVLRSPVGALTRVYVNPLVPSAVLHVWHDGMWCYEDESIDVANFTPQTGQDVNDALAPTLSFNLLRLRKLTALTNG